LVTNLTGMPWSMRNIFNFLSCSLVSSPKIKGQRGYIIASQIGSSSALSSVSLHYSERSNSHPSTCAN
jgi:hypothetical protein